MGDESGSANFEVKEAFSYGLRWPKDKTHSNNALERDNIFPDDPLGSKWGETMLDFYDLNVEISIILSRIFSKAFLEDEKIIGRASLGRRQYFNDEDIQLFSI
eukprot:UN04840